jgi:hypothetical protein
MSDLIMYLGKPVVLLGRLKESLIVEVRYPTSFNQSHTLSIKEML